MADLTIICKDGEVKADRAKMAAASPVFDTVLNGPFTENVTGILNLSEYSTEIVQMAVDYVQKGDSVDMVSDDFLLFLDKYGIKIAETHKFNFGFDDALRLYGKIVDTSLLNGLRKEILVAIDDYIKARYEYECSTCGLCMIYICKTCINNYYATTCTDCEQSINDYNIVHGNCQKPGGKWIVKEKKLCDGDYILIGRAIVELYKSNAC